MAQDYCDFTTGKCPQCDFDVDRRGWPRALKQQCKKGALAAKAPTNVGPGTELKKGIARLGIKVKPSCACNRRVKEMNRHGTDWCRQNMDTIVGWLREEAARRRLPLVEIVARQLIKSAIRRAEKNQTPRQPGVEKRNPHTGSGDG